MLSSQVSDCAEVQGILGMRWRAPEVHVNLSILQWDSHPVRMCNPACRWWIRTGPGLGAAAGAGGGAAAAATAAPMGIALLPPMAEASEAEAAAAVARAAGAQHKVGHVTELWQCQYDSSGADQLSQ